MAKPTFGERLVLEQEAVRRVRADRLARERTERQVIDEMTEVRGADIRCGMAIEELLVIARKFGPLADIWGDSVDDSWPAYTVMSTPLTVGDLRAMQRAIKILDG